MASLGDVITDALKDFTRSIFEPVGKLIGKHADALIRTIVGTPHPNAVFSKPTNGAWPDIYTYYWDTIVPLALFLWGMAIGVSILLESTSHLFSNYHRTKLKKRAFSGLVGVLSWWWIAALSLQLVNGLAGFIVPELSNISLFETLSFGTIGVLGLAISLAVDLVLFLLIALLYLLRQMVLYLFVLLMPLLIVFWVPGVGPFGIVSQLVKRLGGFYVSFLLMTLPVAVIFRLGELLGTSVSLSMGGVGQWLMALVTPFLAVLSPFVLFWQAGALFFMGDRAANRMATGRAHRRLERTGEAGLQATHAGKNFRRGVRGQPGVRRDGQEVFGSGNSMAHRAGSRLRQGGSRLQSALSTDGRNGGPGGGGGAGGSARSGRTSSQSSGGRRFDALRERVSGSTSSTDRLRWRMDDHDE
ncbi:hypothetical protein VB773_19660 [Haloarculaceae archaeon H-GB2-1]|nr:hypothetical protein [Haloarculaceae archaeon H-GB1-1]MEA5409575.1 hypothetical protein [Haloarculaceae archaeon H-GB2-1]